LDAISFIVAFALFIGCWDDFFLGAAFPLDAYRWRWVGNCYTLGFPSVTAIYPEWPRAIACHSLLDVMGDIEKGRPDTLQ
jgi:hypothetical protein